MERLVVEREAATTFDTAAWLVYPSRAFVPRKVRAMVRLPAGEIGEGLRAPTIRPVDLALDLPSMTDRSVADRRAYDGKRYRAYRLIWEILT
jgi:hypothetical protein